jgi:hypothetical protein
MMLLWQHLHIFNGLSLAPIRHKGEKRSAHCSTLVTVLNHHADLNPIYLRDTILCGKLQRSMRGDLCVTRHRQHRNA